MRVYIDYQVRENAYVKHLKHVGNGTLEQWFSGVFSLRPATDRTHEICAQLVWHGSRNRFRLCRIVAHPTDCDFSYASLPSLASTVFQYSLIILHQIALLNILIVTYWIQNLL